MVGACGYVAGHVALWYVGSSQTRDQTHVSCIGRQILNHWTTREVLIDLLKCTFVMTSKYFFVLFIFASLFMKCLFRSYILQNVSYILYHHYFCTFVLLYFFIICIANYSPNRL